jgi:hypothetical protein
VLYVERAEMMLTFDVPFEILILVYVAITSLNCEPSLRRIRTDELEMELLWHWAELSLRRSSTVRRSCNCMLSILGPISG